MKHIGLTPSNDYINYYYLFPNQIQVNVQQTTKKGSLGPLLRGAF